MRISPIFTDYDKWRLASPWDYWEPPEDEEEEDDEWWNDDDDEEDDE